MAIQARDLGDIEPSSCPVNKNDNLSIISNRSILVRAGGRCIFRIIFEYVRTDLNRSVSLLPRARRVNECQFEDDESSLLALVIIIPR